MIFNEKELFDGNIQTLKDDLLKITTEEFEALVRNLEIPQNLNVQYNKSEYDSVNFYKDEDLSLFKGISNSTPEENLEPESSDYFSTQVYSDDNELYTYSVRDTQNSSYETDHLCTDSYDIPYLTPD